MRFWPKKTESPSQPWQEALNTPLFSLLNHEEKRQLIAMGDIFLQRKLLRPLQGVTLSPLDEYRLALLFCLPVLQLGLHYLDGFHEVLLYPAPFIVENTCQDEAGLVHNDMQIESGQSWLQGPIVLNMQDIQESYDLSGYNLVIHEVAHKLDARGGGMMNGIPAIPLREFPTWENQLRTIIDSIREEIALTGEEATTLDAYAASDPAECFAVMSEYFFSAPELLTNRFPDFYQLLVGFYRQDPAERLQPSAAP
ncbi:MAG: Protein MtfA [Candidatus Erwinia impunctatus]|nr:Protein MtfA [Culicoides impunctatus]